ncbi:hypothetical protein Hte_006877 [Hypoxylon texense]
MSSTMLQDIVSSFRGRPKTVCVIGAGVSGLRAAGLLAAVGFEVTILEARDRVGGRVHQNNEFGLPIDLGASWIYGTKRNPLVALAKKTGSTTAACGATYSICDSNGDWLPGDFAQNLFEQAAEILDLAMEKSCKEHSSLPDDANMIDFFGEELFRSCELALFTPQGAASLRHIVEISSFCMRSDCERQSLKNLWLGDDLEGDDLFVASTYSDILAGLRSAIDTKATLRLQCEVTRVSNNRFSSVDVEAADGFRGRFDNVIVTAPLGWLKRNQHVFSPPLAPGVSSAIQALGYGNLEKIFIRFPKAFWDDADAASTDRFLFRSPEYAADTNPAAWRQEIISFSGLPKPFSQPILMFLIYGQWGRHITGLVRGMKRDSEECRRILDDNFSPYYSNLPNYDPASPDCKPSGFLSTEWQDDRFAGYGSLTNLPVGSGDAAEHFEALRNGMGQDRGIWFAGEHTSPPGGLGTVHGAYWSGEEVAKRVASRYDISL